MEKDDVEPRPPMQREGPAPSESGSDNPAGEAPYAMQLYFNTTFQSFIDDLFAHRPAPGDVAGVDILNESGNDLSLPFDRLMTILQSARPNIQRFQLPYIHDGIHLNVLSQSLGQYLKTILGESLYEHLRDKVTEATQKWIASLLRADMPHGRFCEPFARASVAIVLRAALCKFHPTYVDHAYRAWGDADPYVYIADGVFPHSQSAIDAVWDLGLPASSLRRVPRLVDAASGMSGPMDVGALEDMMNRDMEEKRRSAIVVTEAGNHVTAAVDDLPRIRALCDRHGAWMHVEGESLTGLMTDEAKSPQYAVVRGALTADSITVNILQWFSVPNFSSCVLFRAGTPLAPVKPGPFHALPHWIYLQRAGRQFIADTLATSLAFGQLFASSLSAHPSVAALPVAVPSTVVFGIKKPAGMTTQHLDYLNKALASRTRDVATPLGLDGIVINNVFFLRFRPLHNMTLLPITQADIDKFVVAYGQKASALLAAHHLRPLFLETLEKSESIKIIPDVDLSGGIVAFRYVPKSFGPFAVTPEIAGDVDEINLQLAQQLMQHSALFYAKRHTDESTVICIDAGSRPITADEVPALIQLIVTTSDKLEINSKMMGHIEELVARSVRAAEEQLLAEKERRIAEQGVLRQIPGVRNVVGWLWGGEEENKEPKQKGRAFDITTGHLETTESTYKYRMQIPNTPEGGPSERSRSGASRRSAAESSEQSKP